MNNNYLEYISQFTYPDYSHRGTNKSTKNKYLDLRLLDLSLSQSESYSQLYLPLFNSLFNRVGIYSYTQDYELIKLISIAEDIPYRNITISSGADGALNVISRLIINNTTRVLIPLPSFGRYEYHSKINKGVINYYYSNQFPYTLDVNRFINSAEFRNSDILFLSNPNNPTGEEINHIELINILNHFNGYVILDESLYSPLNKSCAKLVKYYNKLIIVRTFSKFYGIAGARIGYCITNNTFGKSLRKMISPFEVSGMSIELAKASLKSTKFQKSQLKKVRECKNLIHEKSYKNYKFSNTNSNLVVIYSLKKKSLYNELLRYKIKTVPNSGFRSLERDNIVRVSFKNKSSILKLLNVLDILDKSS